MSYTYSREVLFVALTAVNILLDYLVKDKLKLEVHTIDDTVI